MECPFPQFGLLPAELRCKVWCFAVPRRTIPVRLKLDLDAWNGAHEMEWEQIHYRLVSDGKPVPLPPVTMVNHEARHEAMKSYKKSLQINRDSMRRALGLHAVDDVAFGTLCNSSRIPWFNPKCDVLEWSEPFRWSSGHASLPSPLFLGACLSVKHISLEPEVSMNSQLETLAIAVLDAAQPLEILNITLKESQSCWRQFRLARRPASIRFSQREEDVQAVLARHSTCFLPWYSTSPAETWPRQAPLGPETQLDTRFSIYQVLRPHELADQKYIALRLEALASRSPLLSCDLVVDLFDTRCKNPIFDL
ncbi:hypothetical protein F5B20DRAFT_569893 [Whalleya microplaca]|nr:hypothetical protein F5B20DRAFT_569893 [Whalleya microplaca]